MTTDNNFGIHPSWIGDHGQMHFGVQMEEDGSVALVYVIYPEVHELTYDDRPWSSTFYYSIPEGDLTLMKKEWESTEEVQAIQAKIDTAWQAWKTEARASLIQALTGSR